MFIVFHYMLAYLVWICPALCLVFYACIVVFFLPVLYFWVQSGSIMRILMPKKAGNNLLMVLSKTISQKMEELCFCCGETMLGRNLGTVIVWHYSKPLKPNSNKNSLQYSQTISPSLFQQSRPKSQSPFLLHTHSSHKDYNNGYKGHSKMLNRLWSQHRRK